MTTTTLSAESFQRAFDALKDDSFKSNKVILDQIADVFRDNEAIQNEGASIVNSITIRAAIDFPDNVDLLFKAIFMAGVAIGSLAAEKETVQ